MESIKILLFGGTTEGRILTQFLEKKQVSLTLYVATEYGADLLETVESPVYPKRLDQEEIKGLLQKEKFDLVVDATHPFAELVTRNIYGGCQYTNTPYIRVIRKSEGNKDIQRVRSIEEAVVYLSQTQGNILLTTGSKSLEPFTQLQQYKERIYIRLLPIAENIEKCRDLGFALSHLVAMQGPFSKAMNEAILEHTNAKYMVTKDSGDVGGVEEKIEACQKKGVQVILVDRPKEEEGYLLEEAKIYLNEFLRRNKK